MSAPSTLVDPDRRFFAWRTTHPSVAEDPRAAWAEAWRQGYWAGVRENALLGARLLEVVERVSLLEHSLREQRAEDEQTSAYWHTDGSA
jgi:hypothetical protein